MEKIKWSDKVTNEQVLDRVGEKRTLLLRRNCLLHDAIEAQMTEVKGVRRRRRRRRRMLLLDELRNSRRYWEEAED